MRSRIHSRYSGDRREKKRSNNLIHSFYFLSDTWPIFLLLLSILSIWFAWFVFDVSPFQTQMEKAYQQHQFQQNLDQEKKLNEMITYHLILGEEFLKIENVDGAINEFESALKLDPLNLSAKKSLLKSEIFKSILKRDYDRRITLEALYLLQKNDQTDPFIFFCLGAVWEDIDDFQAIEYYQKAIEIDPSIGAAYFRIGEIYELQGKYDDSLKMYKTALGFDIWNQKLLDNLGYEYYLRKEYTKSIEIYEKLLRLNQSYLRAYYLLSNDYRLTGNLEQALRDQEEAIRLLNNSEVISMKINQDRWYFDKSNIYYIQNYPQKKFYAYYNIALTYYLLGNETKVKDYIKKADELHIDKEWESNIKNLVNFDINNLQEEQKSLHEKTDEFKSKFL